MKIGNQDPEHPRRQSGSTYVVSSGAATTVLATHTGDTDDAHDASAISYDNGASGLTADDVQAAIDELAGGAVSIALDDLSDVDAPAPADGDVLTFDSGSGDWIASAGGALPTDVWAWMPLTSIDGGDPVLVWDDDDSLIPTLVPLE